MALQNLWLGRHLRRDIEAQSEQLGRDIEQVKFTASQLRRTAAARLTSPVGLASAAATGFVMGKIIGRPSSPKRRAQRAANHIASLASRAFHSFGTIGIQMLVPIAIEWVQSKFAGRGDDKNAENADAENAAQNRH